MMHRPLSLSRKILNAHRLTDTPVETGRSLRISVDWIMASELAIKGMQETFDRLGNPPLHAPDRFFLAIDHTVDPQTIRTDPKTGQLVRLSREFASARKLTAFYDANETIMHTAFYRYHALPGTIVVGADSHTTSHGALGAFAIGLGGADVAAAAVQGHTWITVPPETLVRFRGALPFGLSGKDIVLKTLGVLGCSRSVLDHSVEFRSDPGHALSLDARFTICNMTAELGGVNGIFAPGGQGRAFLERFDRNSETDETALFSDPGARYEETVEIDLAALTSQVARPFSPDKVSPVSEYSGQSFDGCFIGACTTTEEELVIAGLVLERMLQEGVQAQASDKRLVIPGDLAIRRKLEERGIWDIYRKAGFRVGVPGCHMCLGLGTEKAGQGETWLSSQNRNYRNRMGAGSIAWLASAATVAVSAPDLTLTDPGPHLAELDRDRLQAILATPEGPYRLRSAAPPARKPQASDPQPPPLQSRSHGSAPPKRSEVIKGRVLVFGDNIDTDAIIPGEFCNLTTPEDIGPYCFRHVRPETPTLAGFGMNVIVAGHGWGCGSSREHAAWALKGIGIRAVIAKSFGMIHRRNLINEGLLPITLKDPSFTTSLSEGDSIEIDLAQGTIRSSCTQREWSFEPFGGPEKEIFAAGGLVRMMLDG